MKKINNKNERKKKKTNVSHNTMGYCTVLNVLQNRKDDMQMLRKDAAVQASYCWQITMSDAMSMSMAIVNLYGAES